MTTHLYLSPHLDDAVFSCGALIHAQTQCGERVIVMTICAGEGPSEGLSPFAQSLHDRWQAPHNAVATRRAEDVAALEILHARYIQLNLPDCIYRFHPAHSTPLYASEEALFGEWHPAEQPLARQVAQSVADLRRIVRATDVYAPLGIGRHVDHQLTRRAAELTGLRLHYYEDYPYAGRIADDDEWGGLAHGLRATWQPFEEANLDAQCRATLAYRSQVSSFWADEAAVRAAFRAFAERSGNGLAIRTWQGV